MESYIIHPKGEIPQPIGAHPMPKGNIQQIRNAAKKEKEKEKRTMQNECTE